MKAPKIISEKDQAAISDLIEKFMPDDDKALESAEIIKHLGDSLSEDAGENALIEHLSKNSEKKFTRDEMKILSGKFGVEKYKANYEASQENSNSKEKAQGDYDNDEAERINRFMNGPDSSEVNRPRTVNERISDLSKENKVIFENIKSEWIKTNKDKFEGLSEDEIEQLADKIVIDALESSIKQSGMEKPDNKQSVNPMQASPMSNQMQQGLPQGVPQQVSGSSFMDIAMLAYKLTRNATASVAGGAAGVAKGVKEGVTRKKNEAGLTIAPEQSQEEVVATPAEDNTYVDQVANSSQKNMASSIEDLNAQMEEVRELREKGEWANTDTMSKTKSKLDGISEKMDEINDLKNILNSDLKRDGVSDKTRMDSLKALDEAKKSIKDAKDGLGNSDSEKEVKQKAEKIMKAIDRIVKAIKNLFSKEKTRDEPENSVDNDASLSM